MWSNLSAIAEKAKEVAHVIESQINDSMAAEKTEEDEKGWEKCDNISNHHDDNGDVSGDNDGEKVKGIEDRSAEKAPSSGMSFVDLKDAAKDMALNEDENKMEKNNIELADALARIEYLEKQVNSLKDELTAAREESQNYHATNLLLEQQVQELQEENASLKVKEKSDEGGDLK